MVARGAPAEVAGESEEARRDLRWSYADSPFCTYGEEHLAPVRDLFDARPDVFGLDDGDDDGDDKGDEGDEEYELRLRAMETALAQLDAEGLFGTGEERHGVVIDVAVPSEGPDRDRTCRLNPPESLPPWLADQEACETR